jgi:hypothetical protein
MQQPDRQRDLYGEERNRTHESNRCVAYVLGCHGSLGGMAWRA